MKLLITFAFLLLIHSSYSQAVDSLQRDGRWWYCYEPKNLPVRSFYPEATHMELEGRQLLFRPRGYLTGKYKMNVIVPGTGRFTIKSITGIWTDVIISDHYSFDISKFRPGNYFLYFEGKRFNVITKTIKITHRICLN